MLRFFGLPAGTALTIPSGETEDEGWFEPRGGFNPQFTFLDYVRGTIENESDLDETLGIFPLGNSDLVALEGQCICAVVYDSDVSINFTAGGGTEGNLQGATLGLTAFNVLTTLAPGGLPESGSSTSLKDVEIELVDPELVPLICGDTVESP